MFRLHELTQRQMVRLLFVLACLLPTASVLAWGLARHWPGAAASEARQLEQLVGLPVSVEAVEYPRPGAILMRGVDVLDPQTKAPILRSSVVESSDNGAQRVVRVGSVEIDGRRAALLWEALQRQLRKPAAEVATVRLLVGQATWQNDVGGQSFVDLLGRIKPSTAGNEAELTFRLAGEQMPEPMSLHVVRRPAEQGGACKYTLRTGSTPLPVTALSPLVDASPWLGNHCRFHGWLWLDETAAGWQGELAGRLSAIDLDALVTRHFPHTLSGAADVQIERARWENNRLLAAAGTLQAGPGIVSRSLVTAVGGSLQVLVSEAPLPAVKVLRLERLACDFLLEAGGLTLVGRAPSETRGALLVAQVDAQRSAALWTTPVQQPQPVTALVRGLVPVSQLQVPATLESDLLLRHLPVPAIMPSADQGNREPSARLRMGTWR